MKKSPILAFLLSIIPGLGHVYAMGTPGIKRGLIFLGSISLSMWLCFLLIGFVMVPILWIWCAVDAAGQAVLRNKEVKCSNSY